MNIRIMGEKNLILSWANELEKAYNIKGKMYHNRGDENNARIYFNMDDRQAEQIIKSLHQQGHTNERKQIEETRRTASGIAKETGGN